MEYLICLIPGFVLILLSFFSELYLAGFQKCYTAHQKTRIIIISAFFSLLLLLTGWAAGKLISNFLPLFRVQEKTGLIIMVFLFIRTYILSRSKLSKQRNYDLSDFHVSILFGIAGGMNSFFYGLGYSFFTYEITPLLWIAFVLFSLCGILAIWPNEKKIYKFWILPERYGALILTLFAIFLLLFR
mgnify:CR=1 FL=1